MSVGKNDLERVLIDALIASGVKRQQIFDRARNYMRTISMDRLRTEISQIDSVNLLTLLQAVGVPKEAQQVFFSVYDRTSTRG